MNSFKNCSNPLTALVRPGILMPSTLVLTASFFLSGVLLIQSCSPSSKEMDYQEKSKMLADSVAHYLPGLSTDSINGISHNFIRTADIKCKVAHVLQATNKIEDLLAKKGGYISLSNFSSQINYTNKTQFKKDSILESTHYTTTNSIQLRIPVAQLDSLLREISDLALFVDFRKLKADDVKMDLFANALSEKRLKTYQSAVKTKLQTANDKITALAKAEEGILEKQTIIDNTRLNSYDLADKVNYSTLTLELYQSEMISTQVLFNPPPAKPYSPSFLEELKLAFFNGLTVLKTCVIFLVNSWGLILFFVSLFFLIKTVRAFIIKRIH